MQSTDMLTDEKVSVRDYDYCLSFSISKIFKTNRKKLTIAVSNYVEQNNVTEEVDIENSMPA